MNPVFDVKEATLKIDGKTILEAISFAVQPGESIAIIGPNGAGKTSLIHLLTGFIAPTSGEVWFQGTNLSERATKQQQRNRHTSVGIVHQGLSLVGRLSAKENVLIGRLGKNKAITTWFRHFKPEDHRFADDALRKVGLLSKADQRTDTLSGGERQRVAIARSLVQEARVMIADEMTAALDPNASKEIAGLMSGLKEQLNLSIVSILHDLELLPIMAERVVGMANGSIRFDLPTKEIDDELLKNLFTK